MQSPDAVVARIERDKCSTHTGDLPADLFVHLQSLAVHTLTHMPFFPPQHLPYQDDRPVHSVPIRGAPSARTPHNDPFGAIYLPDHTTAVSLFHVSSCLLSLGLRPAFRLSTEVVPILRASSSCASVIRYRAAQDPRGKPASRGLLTPPLWAHRGIPSRSGLCPTVWL